MKEKGYKLLRKYVINELSSDNSQCDYFIGNSFGGQTALAAKSLLTIFVSQNAVYLTLVKRLTSEPFYK